MSTTTDPAGAQQVLRPRLGSLIADPDAFATDQWGVAPRHTPAAELRGDHRALFSTEAVDELLSARGLRTPFLRVAREGTTLGDGAFTAPGGVGAAIGDQLSDDKLLGLFAGGSTLVLQALHRTWAPLTTFTADLAAELGHPVQVNGYVTPAQNRGFDDHYDVHDVFVLQVAGRKHWRVRPPVHPHPLRDQPWTDHRAAVARAAELPPELDVVLEPGDTLYVPRGWLHSATALGGATTHLTMGIHTWTRHHLLTQLVAEAVGALAQDPEIRAQLDVGVDVSDPARTAEALALVRARLQGAVDDVDPTAVAARMGTLARTSQRAAPVRPLATLAAADALTGDEELVLRDHVSATLVDAGIRSRAGLLELSSDDTTAVAGLLGGAPTTVHHLGTDLARRLVLGGVATVRTR